MAQTETQTDREAIVAHLHGLFEAYKHKDAAAVRRGHTADWCGFHIRSRTLVRGIDEYMKLADEWLGSKTSMVSYEFLDMDVQVYGDIGIVYYLAREKVRDEKGVESTFLLRSVDVYRRDPGGWNQCGSNIYMMPDER